MEPHKKLSIVFAPAILAAALSAQEKVAVLPPLAGRNVTEINKKTVRSAFFDYITEPGSGYAAHDRNSTDLAVIEPGGRTSALYDEKVARDIGKKLGVSLVCIIDLTRDERDFLIECKLVRVDTGKAVSKSEIVSSLTNAEIKKASEGLVRKLMAREGTITTGAPTVPAAVRAEPPSRAAAAAPHNDMTVAARESRNLSKPKKPTYDGRWFHGVSLAVANPSGGITNNKELLGDDLSLKAKMGLGLSAFGEFGLNDKMALRGRVGYTVFGEGKKEESESEPDYGYSRKHTNTLSASATTLFADFIYRFNSHEKGPYAFAGLGLVNGKLEWAVKDEYSHYGEPPDTEKYKGSMSGSNLGFSVGLGYNFTNNLGVEASYVTASNVVARKYEDHKNKLDFSWMQVSFKYRERAREPKKSLGPNRDGRWFYGVSLAIANPGGDFTNEDEIGNKIKMGFGASAFGEFALNDKMALRGRVGYTVFGEGKKEESEPYFWKHTDTLNANVTTVFADFIYSLDSHEKGPYAFAGLGLVSGKVGRERKYESTYYNYEDKDPQSGSNLGSSFGLGYNFTKNIGAELSYVTANDVIKPKDWDRKYGFTWLQASFKCRF